MALLCSGWQIAPAELEDVLLTHPAVADVGVVGVDAPQAGLQIRLNRKTR